MNFLVLFAVDIVQVLSIVGSKFSVASWDRSVLQADLESFPGASHASFEKSVLTTVKANCGGDSFSPLGNLQNCMI